MMYRYVLPILFSILCDNIAAAQSQTFCFDLKLTAGSKRIVLSLNGADWKTGFVQYAGNKGRIAIRRKRTKVLAQPPGRPSDIQYDYEEIVGDKVTGLYSFSLQGVAFGDA